jgi:hypothetical protein
MFSGNAYNLTRKTLFFIFLMMSGASSAFAQLQMQNLQVPGFICPGQPMTISFQAQVDASNVQPQVAGVLSPVSATSFSATTDYLFLYSAGNGLAALAPGWFKLDNAFTVTPAGDLSMVTYTWSTIVPAAFTTGEVIYVNISGGEVSDWATDMNMTTDAHLSVAVTVNCSDKAMNNVGVFGGSSSSAALVIQACGSTNTPTNTNSPTPTKTPTPTNTNTDTPTITNTNTTTPTYTNTDSPTPPNTFTDTPTLANSATNTNTLTVTPTYTNSNTPTPSPTFTSSPTPTNTLTPTITNTPVPSATETDTPTITNTNTPTPTPTITNTPVPSATATDTPTVTNTNSPTATPTITNTPPAPFTSTFTNTPTPTYTFTVTPTPTTFVGIGKTVSETLANAGDVLTYNIAVTVTGTGLTSPIITDNLPANMTFQSFGSFPSGAVTYYNSSADQLQWTLPSPLSAGVYHLTYQTKVNTFAPANTALTNNVQFNYAGLAVPLSASVPITVIGNFTVKINIYNSAGEVVKSLPIESFSTAINNIALSTTNTITTLSGPGSTIDILFNGYVIGIWDGTNSSDSPVSNGAYQIQVDNVNSTGIVTSVSQKAIVNRNLSKVEVDIFNQAGEVVRRLYNVTANATNSTMTNVSLSTNVMKPNLGSSFGGTTASNLTISVQDSSAPVTLVWDGTSDSGTFVTPGEYEVQVHWTDGNGTTTDITRTVLVLPSASVSGVALVEPNVLTSATTMSATFDVTRVLNATGMKVKIFTVAGELIQSFSSSSMTVPWSASGLASGIYIANVEIDNASGGIINNQRLKILVLH